MFADFYIPRVSNDMKIAVQKHYLGGLILYTSVDLSKNGVSVRKPHEIWPILKKMEII